MVSFQCEGCGDVLTKKKLDPHRNQCRGAQFTCIDCMTTFQGTTYRAHTSCMTEDQKYQGALYREKPSKAAKRKSVSIVEPNDNKALVPRQAYVEDDFDTDSPPHVPTPPPAVPDTSNRDSVFDYMVDDSSQIGTPHIQYATEKEEMAMKRTAPSIFTNSRPNSRNGEEHQHSRDYLENGYTWGAEPVKPRGPADLNSSSLTLEFMTPAAKDAKARLSKSERPKSHSRTNSGSEKKRKRPEDDQIHELEGDTRMTDASKTDTPAIVHSGLTGGLSRMLSQDEAYPFRRSPDNEDKLVVVKERSSRRRSKLEDPTSPLKRTRHSKDVDSSGLGISIKGRAVKALSMVGGALMAGQGESQMSGKTRRRASSSDHGQSLTRIREGEKRERKKHKVQRHNGTASANVRHEPRSRHRHSDDSRSPSREESSSRKLKTIEYRKHDDSASDSDSEGAPRGSRKSRGANGDMVVFGQEEKTKRATRSFLANAPGLESDKGYSVHKMLKRWHKDNHVKSSGSKVEEEQDLWRSLRIKRNEKGEYVLCM